MAVVDSGRHPIRPTRPLPVWPKPERRNSNSSSGCLKPIKTAEGFQKPPKNNTVAIETLRDLFTQTEVHLWDDHPKQPNGLVVDCPLNTKLSNIIGRYWNQRYNLFSKFDQGIKMDVEGWFSVTPEAIAKHQARRCCGTKGGSGTIVDCFTGVGGNVIQFAQQTNCQRVIAIDIDSRKLQFAIHNAKIYGIDRSKVMFMLDDAMVVGPKLRGDVVFLSPPWGGPDYLKHKTFDINTMLKPCGGQALFDMAKKIAPKIVMFLPKNVDPNQLAELALSASPPWSLEVEKNYLNGRLKAVTAYFTKIRW
ncbi:OLC1v1019952C1 [Oldenlandia corymbosa var. corymbosa]|uniref:Trimethylguanosine synthase n=1 Tax=Oldenlandia corymbosa var. corymbosa TaxID=529605 RepID=A0AAV1EF57_OLDCO|nr:OLC1v1019952C1 [Oldenlandia corymbosa var. corymbosa]